MIQPQELRYKNLVNYQGETIEIHGVSVFDAFNSSIGDIPLHCLEPITLTEEWMLKAGAEAYEFDHKPSQYRIGDRLIVVRDGCFYEYGTNLKLEFVHRFQNLFFELQNGKELEFKL